MNVPLVGDYGSGFSKVGFGGSVLPRATFPTVLGTLLHDQNIMDEDGCLCKGNALASTSSSVPASQKSPLRKENEKAWFIGEETLNKKEQLCLHYPISRATVTNWDNMEKVGVASSRMWHHSFYQVLKVAPEQHPLLITEAPLSTIQQKEKVLQILFEAFRVPALYLANQGVLSLFTSGLISGTTIECGEGMTYSVPVIDGYALPHSTFKMEVAGQDLTLYLMKLLEESGNSFVGEAQKDYIQDIKEKYCYVTLKFDKTKEQFQVTPQTQNCQLPDGQEIIIGPERFLCPEILFQPDLFGELPEEQKINSLGIHMQAFQSINSCTSRLWKTLFENILLAGGTGSCVGLQARLQKELGKLVHPNISVKVSNCPFPNCSAWIGGSILSSLSTFKDMWITSNEYKDFGSSIAGRRTF
ncbi:actin-like [Suncus etruscus]|uniref:actin-like n=1 Tax=Suncus etruscus TaxID=109475 RepID=UPI002110BFAB|nr:actin-like [Suncus etruscus]